VPSRRLYPHQWSWDSAFHALGWARVDLSAACAEIDALLGAQWPDGRIPQIAFDPAVAEDAYFPGAGFWRGTERGTDGRVTSALVQPPVHAAIVNRLGADREWLADAYPRLVAWHDYLLARRVAPGRRLVSIVHPWESGMDDSPMWDDALAGMPTAAAAPYTRRDLAHGSGDPDDRPADAEYDRFVQLATAYRDRRGADDLGSLPFVVECPLFSASLAWSEAALADIATTIGSDPTGHRRRAAALTAALVGDLWDERHKLFTGFDARRGVRLPAATAGALAPLLVPLPATIVAAVIATATERFGLGGDGPRVPTVAASGEGFDPGRYWRGPIWPGINWLLVHALHARGADSPAASLRRATVALVARDGFREYFHAVDGRGLGTDGFSWTAAVTLDLLGAPEPVG
jgi:Trehalase